MNYKVKNGFKIVLEFLVIWYGMGMPVPTNPTDIVKLAISMIAVFYTAWKNHDFTLEACEATGLMRARKLQKKDDYVGECFTDEIEEVGDEDA